MSSNEWDLFLDDGVIALTPLRLDDADAHLAGEDAELVRWLNGGPGTVDTVRNYLSRAERMWDAKGPVFTFGVRSVAEDALSGTIEVQLTEEHRRAGRANLAFGLYPDWRGRGYATRSVELALQFLRLESDIRSAVIRVHPHNAPSAAVARRAAFVLDTPAAQSPDGLDWYSRTLASDLAGRDVS